MGLDEDPDGVSETERKKERPMEKERERVRGRQGCTLVSWYLWKK